jgi:uncharacterized membrane protein YfcA
MPLLFESPLFLLLAIVGVTLTGISKSGFAGGAGVVAVPLLALVLPLSQAVALMLPLLIFMDVKSIAYYKDHINKQYLFAILPSALVGIVLAGFLLGSLSESILMLVLACLCISFSIWSKLLPFLANIPGAAFLWGAVSGLTSTLIHAGGPPINIYLMSLKLDKKIWLATAAVFFGAINLTKVVPYYFLDQWSGILMINALLLIPVAWLGVKLGKNIQGKISEQQFMLVCRGLLFSSGIILLFKCLFAVA